MTKTKWGAIIPLIGGFPLGAQRLFKTLPEFILSYPAFEYNDNFYLRYLKKKGWKGQYIVLDPETNEPINGEKCPYADIMVGTPPCSGLSMANISGDRGSDSKTNNWIYLSIDAVNKLVKPKVFIFENAPGLYTSVGAGVRDKLHKIVTERNQSITFFKTNSLLHGLPQKRERTFALIWNSPKCPILDYVKKEQPDPIEYLKIVEPLLDKKEVKNQKKRLKDNLDFQYMKSKGMTYDDMQDINIIGSTGIIIEKFGYEDVLDYYVKKGADINKLNDRDRCQYTGELKKWLHFQTKNRDGKGFWDTPILFMRDRKIWNTLFHRTIGCYTHPIEERYLTPIEIIHLMGMPSDFDTTEVPYYVIGQNVPSYTAADMIELTLPFIKGEGNFLDSNNYNYVMQNNKNKNVDYINYGATKLF